MNKIKDTRKLNIKQTNIMINNDLILDYLNDPLNKGDLHTIEILDYESNGVKIWIDRKVYCHTCHLDNTPYLNVAEIELLDILNWLYCKMLEK
jgi:hypothetical protein